MKRGGQTKYDDNRAVVIIDAIAAGNTRECAAELAGISKRTVATWMAKGREGEEPFAAFAALVMDAERTCESDSVKNIRAVAKGGQCTKRVTVTKTDKQGATTTTVTEEFTRPEWLADSWYLERKHGASWAKDAETIKYLQEAKEREEGEERPLDLSKLSDEKLEQLNVWILEAEAAETSPPGEPTPEPKPEEPVTE